MTGYKIILVLYFTTISYLLGMLTYVTWQNKGQIEEILIEQRVIRDRMLQTSLFSLFTDKEKWELFEGFKLKTMPPVHKKRKGKG